MMRARRVCPLSGVPWRLLRALKRLSGDRVTHEVAFSGVDLQ